MNELKLYIVSIVSIIVIDLIWIGIIMKKFYITQLQAIGRISEGKFQPVIWAAIGVYIALSIGIIHFVMPRILESTTWPMTFLTGALLGFAIYGTYDLTNYSTLKNWTLKMTFVDMVWGSVLCGMVTMIVRVARGM